MASSAQLEHPLSSELLLSAVSAIEECQTMCGHKTKRVLHCCRFESHFINRVTVAFHGLAHQIYMKSTTKIRLMIDF